jgi:hypothetical protein
MVTKIQRYVRTLRLKVKVEGYDWLNAAAIEVNQVWNYANATSYKAASPFAGQARWLSAFDLDKLTAGATECFERIGSDTIQRVNAEFDALASQPGLKALIGMGALQSGAAETQGEVFALRRQSLSSVRARAPRGGAMEIRLLCPRLGGRLLAVFGCRASGGAMCAFEGSGRTRFGREGHGRDQ